MTAKDLEIQKLRAEVKKLTACAEKAEAQLTASQRREQAAMMCDGCTEQGKWEDEREYGYPSPCTKCKRNSVDNYHGPQEAGEESNDA